MIAPVFREVIHKWPPLEFNLMIIGIDASRAASSQRTGTEAYAYYLIEALIDRIKSSPLAPDSHQLRLYFNQRPLDSLFDTTPQVQRVVIPFPRLWTHIRLALELQQQPPDIFFTPAHVIPITYRRPSVATVHDLGYHYFPEAHTRSQVAYLRWSTQHNGRCARRIIADSQATRKDLAHFYGVDPAKIEVIYPGLPPNLQRVEDTVRLTAVQTKYGISPPYLLYIGTLQPRKNLVRLIEAHAHLPDNNHQLVLAGKAGWLAQPILDARRDGVILPGFIDDADKEALISGAAALLYPSLYEGFGFPILEGQACGVPVLCANSSSLPEVAGAGAILVDPLDTAALTTAMQRIINDQPLRRRLIENGFHNVQQFTWQKAAVQLLNVLEKAANNR